MKVLSIGLLGSVTLAACATGGMAEPSDAPAGKDAPGAASEDGQPSADANPAQPDAPSGAGTGALLLSEVVVQPAGAELIEIVNTGSAAVDLGNYYLADHGSYFRLPNNTASLDQADFIVKFPAGATIPAHGVITVAVDTAAAFNTTYGMQPTFAIAGGTMERIATSGTPSLTNGGELVVLFYWDGASDLVRDVDMLLVGAPTAGNGIVDKSGVAIDGPDADETPSMYAADARTLVAQAAAPGAGLSTKRVALESGHEVQNGAGNGLTGDDETSENTGTSWDTSYSAPTPGVVPAALLQ